MFLCLNKKTISLVLVLLLSIQAFSQLLNTEVEAKLNINQINEITIITGQALNKTQFKKGISYKLTVFKTDQNGNKSNNKQSNQLELLANQTKELSTTSINITDTSRTIILLLLYDTSNKLIGKDRIVLNDNESSNLEAKKAIADQIKKKGIPIKSEKEASEEIEAKIQFNQDNEYLSIVGTTFNKTYTDKSLKYKLTVFKIEETESNILDQQTERFVLTANFKKQLATIAFNKVENIKIIVSLLIYDLDDNIIAKDRLVIGDVGFNEATLQQKNTVQLKKDQEKSLDIKVGANDGVEIRGIVVEDTKTKPGRDFYKLFYNLYTRNSINGKEVVVIKEVLALGRNTKIEVIVGYDTIFSFFVNPSSEFLAKMNDYAIVKVYNHFRNLEKESKIIKRY